MSLLIGDSIPFFRARNHLGQWLSSTDLHGTIYILYFYPKDGSPECTAEACSFKTIWPDLQSLGVKIVGVSPDGERSHDQFIKDYGIPFPLLCDESFDICLKFGVLKPKKKNGKHLVTLERTTLLVNEESCIQWLERPVTIERHAERLLSAIKDYVNSLTPP